MPENARVLRFRERKEQFPQMSPEQADAAAKGYLDASPSGRDGDRTKVLSNPDVLTSVLRSLRGLWDRNPALVADEAARIYRWLAGKGRIGLFDERDYFLGEAAFIAGSANRVLGKREEALRWLDRAEAGFRHTLNSAPGLSNVAYARMAVRYEMGLYEDVIELVPSLIRSFVRLAMEPEMAKCELVYAMALKNTNRSAEAIDRLQGLLGSVSLSAQPLLRARLLSEYGDLLRTEGRVDSAMTAYQEALPLLADGGVSMTRADLKMFVGGACRAKGDLEAALQSFRAATADYRELGIATRVAYLNVVTADVLLALDRSREAEWEILQALPTIEEQKMVPEGFAAVALLRESVKRRKTDPNALRELREHLQKKN